MSSVTSFLRQIPTGLQYYALPSGNVYVPAVLSGGSYVNDTSDPTYPLAVLSVSQGSLNIPQGSSILRDMGKTIKAMDTTNGSVVRYFREFQILQPAAATTPISTNDGVIGNDTVPGAYAPYFTIYLPVTILGMGSFVTGLTPLAGGQM